MQSNRRVLLRWLVFLRLAIAYNSTFAAQSTLAMSAEIARVVLCSLIASVLMILKATATQQQHTHQLLLYFVIHGVIIAQAAKPPLQESAVIELAKWRMSHLVVYSRHSHEVGQMCIANALSRTLALPDMQVFKLMKPAAAKSAVQANNKRCIAQYASLTLSSSERSNAGSSKRHCYQCNVCGRASSKHALLMSQDHIRLQALDDCDVNTV
eukprot:4079-Heterococcus_DN1.PRE.3